MRKKATTNVSKEQVISVLKQKHDLTVAEIENSKYNKRAYVNLPLTLLERTFFDIVSKEIFHLDQTKVLRRIIRNLMSRYPEIVVQAKQRIDSDGQ